MSFVWRGCSLLVLNVVDGTLDWYPSSGGPAPTFGPRITIATSTLATTGCHCDLDGNGFEDVLFVTDAASLITVFPHSGNFTPSFNRSFSINVIGAAPSVLKCADMVQQSDFAFACCGFDCVCARMHGRVWSSVCVECTCACMCVAEGFRSPSPCGPRLLR